MNEQDSHESADVREDREADEWLRRILGPIGFADLQVKYAIEDYYRERRDRASV